VKCRGSDRIYDYRQYIVWVTLHKIWFKDLWTHLPLSYNANGSRIGLARTQKSVYARVSIRVFAPAITHRERIVKLVRVCTCVYTCVWMDERTRGRRGAYRSSYTFPRRLFYVCNSSFSFSVRDRSAAFEDISTFSYIHTWNFWCSLINDEL